MDGKRGDQQIEAFVGVERADEAEHVAGAQAELHFQCGVGLAAHFELLDVDGVGDDGDLVRRDATRGQVLAQTLADDGDGIGMFHRPGFQRPGELVAQAAFLGTAVVDRGVFPEGADFIDDGDAELATDANGRHGVEHRRMGMDDIGLEFFRQSQQAFFDSAHHREGIATGELGEQAGGFGRAVEMQAVGVLFRDGAVDLLGAGQVIGVPAHLALIAQDRRAAEGVAGVQR